jgi:hypothetical protein
MDVPVKAVVNLLNVFDSGYFSLSYMTKKLKNEIEKGRGVCELFRRKFGCA